MVRRTDGASPRGVWGWGARCGRLLALSLSALAGLTALLVGSAPSRASGATLLPGFSESVVASGIVGGTAMALAPDGRLFIAEQTGQLRVIKNGQALATPFVTLTVDSTK